MSEQALQRIEQPQPMALDAVGRKAAIDDLINKIALVQEVMGKVMKEGEHFGRIPGCGDKPALLKAGAEKLGMTFRLKANFQVDERDLGRAHREYSVRCMLSDGNMGVGSCSTMESKYRYRSAERACPSCGKATIRQSKKDERHPNGGFYCWAKIGGCGLQFEANDERITGQQTGKVEGDNPADFYNTCLKMAKKRAHVDAIITATACSDIFTQDVEEMVEAANATQSVQTTITMPPPATDAPKAKSEPNKANVAPAPQEETKLPRCQVKMVTEKHSPPDVKKPWTAYFILLNDGFADLEAGTFSKTLAGIASTLSESEAPAEVTIKPGKIQGKWELVNILPVDQPQESEKLKQTTQQEEAEHEVIP